MVPEPSRAMLEPPTPMAEKIIFVPVGSIFVMNGGPMLQALL
jgi:hypothetical protein